MTRAVHDGRRPTGGSAVLASAPVAQAPASSVSAFSFSPTRGSTAAIPTAAPTTPPVAVASTLHPSVPIKPIKRDIVIGSMRPLYGVTVAVDGEPATVASVGLRIHVDNKPHTLTFACMNELCNPQQRLITGGETEETIVVFMSIKPATLVLEGNPQLTYRILEEPTVTLRPRIPVLVPMKSARYPVHVVELPSNRTMSVTLMAGQEKRLAFEAQEP